MKGGQGESKKEKSKIEAVEESKVEMEAVVEPDMTTEGAFVYLVSKLKHELPKQREKSIIALTTFELSFPLFQAITTLECKQIIVGILLDPIINIQKSALEFIKNLLHSAFTINHDKFIEFYTSDKLLPEHMLEILQSITQKIKDNYNFIFATELQSYFLILEGVAKLVNLLLDIDVFGSVDASLKSSILKELLEIYSLKGISANTLIILGECIYDWSKEKASAIPDEFISGIPNVMERKSFPMEGKAQLSGIYYLSTNSIQSILPFISYILGTNPYKELIMNLVPIGESLKAPNPSSIEREEIMNKGTQIRKMWEDCMKSNVIIVDLLSMLFESNNNPDEDSDFMEESSNTPNPELIKSLIGKKLINCLSERAEFIVKDYDFGMFGEVEGELITNAVSALRGSAITCLDNIFNNYPNLVADFSDTAHLHLLKFILSELEGSLTHSDILLKYLLLLKNLLADQVTAGLLDQRDILQFITEFAPRLWGNSLKDIKCLTLNIIGIAIPKFLDFNIESLKLFLSEILNLGESGEIEILCNCLNTIFDIFADEQWNYVLEETGIFSKMHSGTAYLKAKVKEAEEGGEYEENELDFFNDTLTNLSSFIKYKHNKGLTL